mmetsp:Transcript_34420/g.97059  ORF Transcript_34420/g.97059 Transcript_34420/m.97059 type:complete len:398 (-) Transcript_34420:1170-2363(-)|eukprot:CAMPEP_0119124676 /NCGR_PEP_ID=MMETSP1310-20130426/4230_1 /TAXON_ID=464262 /ORGANISM="Genus nov. species nov., Strain RCC2339" /LENGTH=397 /DNA_ID=CAMNT_0007114665 /DNA_START=80 /DNA_END=1273 /DNA_ORIENTATION=+
MSVGREGGEEGNADGTNRGRVCHLILMTHGIESPFGSHTDMKYVIDSLLGSDKFGRKDIHCKIVDSRVNLGQTTDGIDRGGVRLANQIEKIVRNELGPAFSKVYFSFIGHSLGGLYGRYCVGEMRRRGLFDSALTPISFLTIATPHFGSMRCLEISVCDGVNQVISEICRCIWNGRTMRQLFIEDDQYDPLLLRMTDPSSTFMLALDDFCHVTAIGAVRYDALVPFCSALMVKQNLFAMLPNFHMSNSICLFENFSDEYHHALRGRNVPFDQTNLHHVCGYHTSSSLSSKIPLCPSRTEPARYNSPPYMFHTEDFFECRMKLDSRMVDNLNALNWRRVGFAFQAHTSHDLLIQKQTIPYLSAYKEGAISVEAITSVVFLDHYFHSKEMQSLGPLARL